MACSFISFNDRCFWHNYFFLLEYFGNFPRPRGPCIIYPDECFWVGGRGWFEAALFYIGVRIRDSLGNGMGGVAETAIGEGGTRGGRGRRAGER